MGPYVAMHRWEHARSHALTQVSRWFNVGPGNLGQHGAASAWDQLCVPCGLYADMAEHVPVAAGLIEMILPVVT